MAAYIRQADVFVGTTDTAPLVHKQELFLALAGKKPITATSAGHWVSKPDGRRTAPDAVDEVAAFLDKIGLQYKLSQDEYATDAIVGLSAADVESYQQASEHTEIGRLLGYPATAVEAFANDRCMPFEEQEKWLTEAGIPDGFNTFRFSKQYAKEELAVVLSWYRLVEQHGLGDDQSLPQAA